MDISQAQLRPCQYILPPDCQFLPQLGYPDSEGYSSLSPASSTDSYGLSPPYPHFTFPQEIYGSFSEAQTEATMQRNGPKLPLIPRGRKGRFRVAGTQRYSASEREKMRMRNLSKALQSLRRYLPPTIVPAGKNLTKIETLQLTIRYISHLSELLGFSEETLAQSRQAKVRRCDLCPEGLGCSQDRTRAPCAESSAQLSDSFPAGMSCQPSPYCCEPGRPPMRHRAQVTEIDLWFPSSHCSQRSAVPEQRQSRTMAPESQVASPHCAPRTIPLQHMAQTIAPQPYLSFPHCSEPRTYPVQQTELLMDTNMLPFFPGDFNTPAAPRELKLNPEVELPLSSPASPDMGFYQDILDEMYTHQADFNLWTSLQS